MTWNDHLEQALAENGAPHLMPGALDPPPKPVPVPEKPRVRRVIEHEAEL